MVFNNVIYFCKSGTYFDGTTLFVNASVCTKSLKLKNAPIIVDLPHDKKLPANVVGGVRYRVTQQQLGLVSSKQQGEEEDKDEEEEGGNNSADASRKQTKCCIS